MRREVAKAVKEAFGAGIRQDLPFFEPARGDVVPDGSVLYRWAPHQNVTLYVLLQPHRTEDSFTIELAWTLHERFPDTSAGQAPSEESPAGELAFRLGRLFPPYRDYWWAIVPPPSPDSGPLEYFVRQPLEVALARVDSVVADAFDRLKLYGMPFFQRVIERHAA